MISKELLREVLGVNPALIDYNKQTKELELRDLNIDGECVGGGTINIYELAHKCKEWALKQGYWFETRIQLSGTYLTLHHDYMHIVDLTKNFNNADSEQQAVFDACQWILDNKDK